jgi:hypothetical protein
MNGHEKSLLRKRARLEAESHRQDEYVTEADMVRRSLSNLRHPITRNTPTAINEVWRQTGNGSNLIPCPATHRELCESSTMGRMKSLQYHQLVSSVVRHVKGSERGLSQRINCYASNAGTECDFLEATTLRDRRADRQCHARGSESVVVGGVTPTQGERESRSQGEGTQAQPVSRNSETDGSRPYQRQP